MELLKLLDTNEIIAQVLSFLVLFFLLRAFAWKKILELLDHRKATIASEFKKINDTKAEIEQLKTEYENKISAIEKLAGEKIQEAMDEGRKITDEIRKKAYEDADEIITNAKASIKYELSKAQEELKEKIIDLTMSATENLIQEKLTPEDDKKIVESFLKGLDEV